jgi:hypothetical protein
VLFLQGHYDVTTPSRYQLVLVPMLALVVARGLNAALRIVLGIALPLFVAASEFAHPLGSAVVSRR